MIFFSLKISRRIIGRKREIQKHVRRIGPNTQRITRLLSKLLLLFKRGIYHTKITTAKYWNTKHHQQPNLQSQVYFDQQQEQHLLHLLLRKEKNIF